MTPQQIVARCQVRVIEDALIEATKAHWLRRAEEFTAVGTPACDEIARACRNRASLWELTEAQAFEALHQLLYGILDEEAA